MMTTLLVGAQGSDQRDGRKTLGMRKISRRGASSASLAVALSLSATLVGGISGAHAVEGGVYGAPLGGTDIRQAYLPPEPGLYGGIAGVSSRSPNYRDQNGNISATANPAFLYATIAGAGLLYEYPFKPLGFSLASSFQLNYIGERQALTAGGRFLNGYAAGLQDSFADYIFASKYLGLFGAKPGDNPKLKYGLTGSVALSGEIPIGHYNVNNFVNPGKNTLITIPNVALTYLTGPNLSFGDGTEISARFFFDTNARDAATGYQGGNLIDLDYAISQRFGQFQAGIAGDYAQQLNGDHNATYGLVAPGGDIYAKIDLGPVFVWDNPQLATTFKLKALFPVYHQDNYNATSIVLSAARKLY